MSLAILSLYLMRAIGLVSFAVLVGVAAMGAFGAAQVALTRPDAFEADSRQSKWVWFAMLVGSAAAVGLQLRYLWIAGAVIIGVYWMDVHPGIKDLLSGRRNAW